MLPRAARACARARRHCSGARAWPPCAAAGGRRRARAARLRHPQRPSRHFTMTLDGRVGKTTSVLASQSPPRPPACAMRKRRMRQPGRPCVRPVRPGRPSGGGRRGEWVDDEIEKGKLLQTTIAVHSCGRPALASLSRSGSGGRTVAGWLAGWLVLRAGKPLDTGSFLFACVQTARTSKQRVTPSLWTSLPSVAVLVFFPRPPLRSVAAVPRLGRCTCAAPERGTAAHASGRPCIPRACPQTMIIMSDSLGSSSVQRTQHSPAERRLHRATDAGAARMWRSLLALPRLAETRASAAVERGMRVS